MATTFGCCGEFDDPLERNVEFLVRVMRVRSDRAVDIVEALGDGADLIELADAGRNGDERADAGLLRPRHDLIKLRREFRKIEMAMVIDEHQTLLLFCLACPPCGALSASAGST